MKVLQMLPSLDVGGVERGVIDLARSMKNRQEQMVVISSGGKLVAELQKMTIPHYELPIHKKSLMTLSLIPKIIDIIRKERITLIHARSRVPAWVAWFVSWRTGIPLVTTCHGYYSNHFLSRVMGWGKFVIVISRIIGRHMVDDFGVSPERIRLIHRGIDLSEFSFQDRKKDRDEDFYRIINVGRLSPIKGQLEFLRAIHLLRQRLPKLEVWFVGSEVKGKTKYTAKLQKTIHQLGLESCVKLLGTRRDVSELIAQSDLLVLSTLTPEAFGRVVVEAGAVGTPVVATRVGGILDVIDHGENGFLVSPGDSDDMVRSMHKILTDRACSDKFSIQLRQKVEKQFNLEQMVEKTLAVYEEAEQKKKILIIKLGSMGDLILGTPSFRMIRHRFPEAWISVLVDKKWGAMISACPYANEVIPINRKKLSRLDYLLKLSKKLRKEKYDISVDLQNSKWTHLLSALAGIPERYGFRRGKFGFLVNRHDRSFDLVDSPVRHQFRILSKLGILELDEELELWPEPTSNHRIKRMLAERNVDSSSKLVGFAIGASPRWGTKRWPLESYKLLGEKLIREQGCSVILIGSEHEAKQSAMIIGERVERYIDFIGRTSVQDLVSLIDHLDVLVSGDTASLHIAAAMKTRFVTLFGPTDPKRHVPPGDGSVLVTHHLSCQPCYKGQCSEKVPVACLKNISVDEVYEAVCKQLKAAHGARMLSSSDAHMIDKI